MQEMATVRKRNESPSAVHSVVLLTNKPALTKKNTQSVPALTSSARDEMSTKNARQPAINPVMLVAKIGVWVFIFTDEREYGRNLSRPRTVNRRAWLRSPIIVLVVIPDRAPIETMLATMCFPWDIKAAEKGADISMES